MSKDYPWFKFAHVEYLLDPMITSLSLAAQGANTRLMAYAARQLPFGTLPNDDKTLLAMSGAKTVKQWQKLYQELIGTVWFCDDDGRLYCPLMIVESVPQAKQDDYQDTDKPLTDAERAKRYRDSKKNRDEKQEASHDRHDSVTPKSDTVTERHDSVTTASHDRHESNVTNRDEMGGKGGDLDLDLKQDLDKEQEVKTKTTREASVCDVRFDEFWIQYPRKENKQGALKAWKKIKPSEKLFEEIILAVAKQKLWPAFQNGYAPHAATWLNGNRWEDQAPINQPTNNHSQTLNGTSSLMEANRKAVAEAKIMLFGNGEAA